MSQKFWQCRDRSIDLSSPKIMGIVNVTPDSFSDGGKYYSSVQAIEHGLQLAEEGADILDIGGESTRPGADEVSVHSELERVIPVIEALSARGLVVSVDTSKPEVMTAAAQVGAQIINDVYALRREGALEAAEKSGMYYVNQRWLGGMLTNFGTIRKRVERLNELETMQEDGTFDVLPKKEVILLKKEMDKLQKNLGGIKDMTEIPGVLFVVDPKKERIAILEAKKLNIPVVGLVDTNCNPEDVDYAIPGNDDAIRAVKLIADVMANAIIEGHQGESEDTTETNFEEVSEAPSIEEVVAAESNTESAE